MNFSEGVELLCSSLESVRLGGSLVGEIVFIVVDSEVDVKQRSDTASFNTSVEKLRMDQDGLRLDFGEILERRRSRENPSTRRSKRENSRQLRRLEIGVFINDDSIESSDTSVSILDAGGGNEDSREHHQRRRHHLSPILSDDG